MNYKTIYLSLCEKGKIDRKLDYLETHHIIPKCMGGDDSKNNLTKLTAKEHYIAHMLLCRIYNNTSLMYAFGMMKNNSNKMGRRYTSGQYDKMKTSYSKAMKISNPMFKDETRKKVSETKKRLFSEGILKPAVFSDDVRRKLSEKMIGDNNPLRKDPSKNRTSQPIRIYFEDGRIEYYSYAKEYCLKSGVPYSTIKLLLRAENSRCKKHKILKIERIK